MKNCFFLSRKTQEAFSPNSDERSAPKGYLKDSPGVLTFSDLFHLSLGVKINLNSLDSLLSFPWPSEILSGESSLSQAGSEVLPGVGLSPSNQDDRENGHGHDRPTQENSHSHCPGAQQLRRTYP